MLPLFSHANDLSFDVSGQARGFYGYSDINNRYKDNHSSQNAVGDFEVNTEISYDINPDYKASLNLDLNAGIDHELKNYNQGVWGEEAYGIFDTPFGRLMAGQTYNVAKQFHVGAPNAGNFDKTFISNFIQNPNWKRTSKDASFATLTSTDINTDGTAPKITYITPEFYGSYVGVSYVPEIYNRRGLVNKYADYAKEDGYVLSAYHYEDLGFADLNSSVGYGVFHNDDKEFSLGLNLSRGNWSLGGSWRKTYVDGQPYETKPLRTSLLFDNYREASAWEVGLGYDFGPYSMSLSYFDSKADNTKNHDKVVMLSNVFQVNKYMEIYALGAYSQFEGQTHALEENNKGYAVITGVGFKF